jgi:xylulose-5-phosphate/fructose-6-phosphate phosphoketolase
MHRLMAETLDVAPASIRSIQQNARDGRTRCERPRWPTIVLRSPKGWTGPKEVDGLKVEGFWRAHQVPIANPRGNPAHLKLLEAWMRSYEPEKLFDRNGRLVAELQALAPSGQRRMGANPHANGGLLKRELKLPDFRKHAIDVPTPGGVEAEATRELGKFLREIVKLNAEARNFRIMGPDETASNRLDAVFEATERVWMERIEPYDVHLAQDG